MESSKYCREKVTIIGSYNPNDGSKYNEGGQVKTHIYYQELIKHGVDVQIIDLTGWKKHILSIVLKINAAMKENRTILVMTGPNGSRRIVPLVASLKKKNTNKLIFCPIGVGAIDKILVGKTLKQLSVFPKGDFSGSKDNKLGRALSKFDFVLLQSQYLIDSYSKFYHLNNCRKLTNYRQLPLETNYQNEPSIPKGDLLFFGRVSERKGIFILIEALKILNKKGLHPTVNLYGRIDMTGQERKLFDSFLSDGFVYHGIANQKDKYQIMKANRYFVLPTYWEGVPGAWVESLLAGVPSIMTRYPVAEELITDGKEGYLVDVGSPEQLADAIEKALYHTDYEAMKKNALTLSKQYILEENEDCLIKSLLGLAD